ncbi:PIN domain-containing protein [Patulibacter brassicae]|uniref:Ribonuclease VapC n=1 Tax=Patulibacter brassicae TaxID=1705717 RepID=A0ABU4VRU4_9ACTN|nr:PIN domain-containing protein [Patulibacter brassicae]MDX8153618.1 PIN domain-containing protein [Patulibacter brassicae]
MSYVVDASALIALLRDEPGADQVEAALADADGPAHLSTVNLAEVHQALGPDLPVGLVGAPEGAPLIVAVSFSIEHARIAAALRPATRELGLSLADRACLALARAAALPALTADRAWARADVGVDVRVIR